MNPPRRVHLILFVAFLLATVFCYRFLDIPVAYWCRRLDRAVLNIAQAVTRFGKSTAYLIAAFLLFLFFRFVRKRDIFANRSLFVFSSVAVSGIAVNVAKWIAGRYRPVMLFDQGRYGFVFFRTDYKGTSFASGHAVTAFSLALALSFLFPKYRVPLFLAAAAVAASRVLLTAHFLGDVVFGAYIGIATVLVLKAVFERRAPLYRLPGSGTSPGT